MVISLLSPGLALAESGNKLFRSIKDDEATNVLSESLLEEFSENEIITFLVKFKEKSNPILIAEKEKEKSQINKLTEKKSLLNQSEAILADLQSVSLKSQKEVVDFLEKEMVKGNVKDYESFHIVNGMAVTANKKIAEKIANYTSVEKILQNEVRQLHETTINEEKAPQSSIANVEWSIDRVNAPQAWAMGIDGKGTVVASIDTGVQWNHSALKNKYRGYKKENGSVNHNYSWFDATRGYSSPYDDQGHGTHVTGTMVGSEEDGSNQIGVAPTAQWIAVKAFTERGGTDRDLLAAAQWILAPGGRVDMAPDVVNNSWGGGKGLNEWYRDVVIAWRASGIFPGFSAGNTTLTNPGGPGSVAVPANYPESFATGAVDFNNRVTSFSLRGPSPYGKVKPDITAPGANIRSSVPGGGYQGMNGTSMSGPAVSGIAALLRQANPNLTVDEMENILLTTTTPLTDRVYPVSPNNGYGFGLVDAYAAVSVISQEKIKISGKITDGKSGESIKDAKIQFVDSNIAPARTNKNGNYSIAAYPGSYKLKISSKGFHSKEIKVNIIDKDIVVNTILQPFGTIPGKEISYDDGSAEDGNVYYEAGNGYAVKMSLPKGKTSAVVTDGMFHFLDSKWPTPGGNKFAVEVWDASGLGGTPGKKIAGPIDANALRNGKWTTVNLKDHNIIVNSNFYMVYIQTQPNPFSPGLGIDKSSFHGNRGYRFLTDSGFQSAPRSEGNYMIRARVDYEDPVARISGDDRYKTSIKISQNGWEKSDTVIIAEGNGFADALAGVPLAHKTNAPVLLTLKNKLYQETLEEIKRLDASKVIILGGSSAISDSVVKELQKNNLKVERIAGKDRFETAAKIAFKVAPAGINKATIVNGLDFPDALSVASHAAKEGLPILLTQKNVMPKVTKDAINRLGVTETILVGGPAVISKKVENSLPWTTRLDGKDRYETNVSVANYFGVKSKYAYIATGKTYADALTGAVLSAKNDSAVILVHDRVPEVVTRYITNQQIKKLTIYGGENAVNNKVATELRKLTN